MTERPILFSAPMVKAILAGTKTQTRRVIKPQPPSDVTSAGVIATSREGQTDNWTWLTGEPKDCDTWEAAGDFRTRFLPGDMLWVRETWCEACELDGDDKPATELRTYYRADGEPFSRYLDPDTDEWRDGVKWKPSIFMPRWASRITLRVTAVKVERLQDISEEDAVAEGIKSRVVRTGVCTAPATVFGLGGDNDHASTAVAAFRDLWTSISGAASWEANPWVSCISFERVK